ncbi:MAG: GNA1162 family protein [Nitrospiria bacterium]
MKIDGFLLVSLFLVSFFANGCSGLQRHSRIPVNPNNPIRSVAILPMLNNSDDVNGPIKVRKAFYERIQKFHYEVQPIEETTQILNLQMGITLGKQLELTSPKKLGETLGVDGVFYGYLLNFDEVTLGIVNTYKVQMGWKLVDTKTGAIVWGKGVAVTRAETTGGVGDALAAGADLNEAGNMGPLPSSPDPMAEMPGLGKWIDMGSRSYGARNMMEGLAIGLGGKLIDGIMDTRLQKEMNFAFRRLFSGMLIGPVESPVTVK